MAARVVDPVEWSVDDQHRCAVSVDDRRISR
jgi:hypothetical protein